MKQQMQKRFRGRSKIDNHLLRFFASLRMTSVLRESSSLPQFDERCALAAFVLTGFGEGGDVRVGFQELAQRPA